MLQKLFKEKRKNKKRSINKKLIYIATGLIVFFTISTSLYFLLRTKPNDLIKESRSALFENINPNFKVLFGDKTNLAKQYVRFESTVDDNNPFEETETDGVRWKEIKNNLFSSKKGFEMTLSAVKWSGADDERLDSIEVIATNLELDKVETSTEVIEVGRVIGEEEIEESVSKQTVLNKNVFPGIDVEYQIMEDLGVKEEIIIRSMEKYTSSCESGECLVPLNQFEFDLKLDDGLQLKKSSVILRNQTETKYYITDSENRYLAHFLPTFALDASDTKTTDVKMDVIHLKRGNYKVIVTLNPYWLFSSERTFPIRIDPSIVHDTTTEFDTGSNYNTEVVTGPKVQLENPEIDYVDSDVVGYWKLDEGSGTGAYLNDSSSNNNDATPTGTTYISDGRLNSARDFNGSSDYITTGTTGLPTGDFTYLFWINLDVLGDVAPIMIPNASGENEFDIFTLTTGQVRIYTNNVLRSNSSITIEAGKWNHIGVTRSGSTINTYINGVMDPVSGTDGVAMSFDTCGMIIGADADASCTPNGNWVNGIIDEVRVSDIARSTDEIERLYRVGYEEMVQGAHTSTSLDMGATSDIESITWTPVGDDTGDGETPYSTTSMVAQWDFNETSGTTADNEGSCGSSCDGTLTGFPNTTGQDLVVGSGWTSDNRRWGAGALMFDGSNDYMSVSSLIGLSTGNAVHSIEAWIKPGETPSTRQWPLLLGGASAGNHHWLYGTDGIFYSGVWNGGACGFLPDVNEWNYVVSTFDGTTLKCYKNGALITSTSATFNLTSTALSLAQVHASEAYFKGSMDSVRIYSRNLSSTEILSNYQSGNIEGRIRTSTDGSTWSSWSGSETSIYEFDEDHIYSPNTTGLVSYWPMDESSGTSVEDIKGSNEGTASGAYITDGKHRNGRTFDGSNDYISVPDDTSLRLATSLTVEFWYKTKENPDPYSIMFRKDTETGTRYLYGIYINAGNIIKAQYFNGSNFEAVYTSSLVTDGEWHYVVMTINGTTLRLYFDGVSVDSTTISGTQGVPTGELDIGAAPPYTGGARTSYFEGSIDEARISNTVLSANGIYSKWIQGSSNPNTLRTRQSSNYIESDAALELDSAGLTVDANTIGYWKMDEVSGTGAYILDSSPNDNDGTPSGTTYTNNGKVGGARSFNGTSDWVNLGDLSFPSSGTPTGSTIDFWMNLPNTNSGDQYLLDGRDTGNWWLLQDYTASACTDSEGNICFNGLVEITSDRISDNTWHYVAITTDSTESKAYIDGILVATGNGLNASFQSVRVGTRYTNSSYLEGTMDELRISNRVRTAAEIAQTYAMGKNEHVTQEISSSDISSNTMLPFWIASDQLGNNLDIVYGESDYANYEADDNTVGLWGMHNGASHLPKDCSVLRSYGVTTSGVYTIDPDGPGGSSSFDVYCNMTYDGGGWTLLDNFTSELGPSDPYGDAIGYSDIQGTSGLSTAGYSYYLSNIENDSYPRQQGYLQMYYSTTAEVGYIQKVLPSYADEVYVKWGSWYSPSASYLKIGGTTVQTLGSNTGAATYKGSYDPGDIIRFDEGGIMYVGEVWVRDSDADKYVSIEDRSGQSNDGISVGSTITDGIIGDARHFDGTDDVIELGTDSSLSLSSNVTLDAWIKIEAADTDTAYRSIIGNSSGSRNYNFYVHGNGSGKWELHLSHDWEGSGFQGTLSGYILERNKWYHVVGIITTSGGGCHYYYVNGQLVHSVTNKGFTSITGNTLEKRIGSDNGTTWFDGVIDEVRISDVVRTADEIRQTYEVGKRTHPITVDFKTDLESGNLITGSTDKSFTISEQDYGTSDYIENIDVGEKIIVKELSSGTEYTAQGDIDSVNTSTGAVTVDAWDTGSTFPSGGFTVNATVFKWQREYIDIRYPLDEDINAITRLTFKKTTNVPAVFWIDDAQKATYSSDYDASSFTTIEDVQYVQYQSIFTKWDPNYKTDLYVSELEINYSSGPTMDQLMRHGKWFNSSGVEQPFWWAQ